jgi:Rrf2 family protein
MAKVLQQLARRGLLTSQQGARGGYTLARTATGISLADVIQAIDGPVSVTACSTHGDRCGQFAKCNVRDPLWRISDIIVSALSKTMVSELANDVPPAVEKAPIQIVAAPARA